MKSQKNFFRAFSSFYVLVVLYIDGQLKTGQIIY